MGFRLRAVSTHAFGSAWRGPQIPSTSNLVHPAPSLSTEASCSIIFYQRLFFQQIFPQIALAIGVLTSSIGMRVRRFCGFFSGGGCRAGCRLRCRLRMSEVCVEARMIFCPAPEVRIIFLSGAGSKNHRVVKLTFLFLYSTDGYVMSVYIVIIFICIIVFMFLAQKCLYNFRRMCEF